MISIKSVAECEQKLGEDIKLLRLQKNISRQRLCARAGISENALRNLEGGQGSTVKTLVHVLKALDRENWLDTLAPVTSIHPLHLVQEKKQRLRARRKKDEKE